MEADHVAAVASLATRSRSLASTAKQGAAWGAGHALTLVFFGGLVLVMDTLVPERFAQGLELAVGFMLVLLGFDVLRRLVRDRIHFHLHRHDATVHFHAHSHIGSQAHADDLHHHEHPESFPIRAMLVGMMHGMAGSAALIILALNRASSITQALRYSARGFTWAHNGLKASVGLLTIGLGGKLIYELGIVQGLLTGA